MNKNYWLILSIIFLCVLSSCELTEAESYKGNGSAVFYTPSNTFGRIEVTVSGEKINPVSFVVPVTTNPNSYCENGWTGYVLLDVGTYKYTANSAKGNSWSGTIEITKDFCQQRSFQ